MRDDKIDDCDGDVTLCHPPPIPKTLPMPFDDEEEWEMGRRPAHKLNDMYNSFTLTCSSNNLKYFIFISVIRMQFRGL